MIPLSTRPTSALTPDSSHRQADKLAAKWQFTVPGLQIERSWDFIRIRILDWSPSILSGLAALGNSKQTWEVLLSKTYTQNLQIIGWCPTMHHSDICAKAGQRGALERHNSSEWAMGLRLVCMKPSIAEELVVGLESMKLPLPAIIVLEAASNLLGARLPGLLGSNYHWRNGTGKSTYGAGRMAGPL